MIKCECCQRLSKYVISYPFSTRTDKNEYSFDSCIEADCICLTCLGMEMTEIISNE